MKKMILIIIILFVTIVVGIILIINNNETNKTNEANEAMVLIENESFKDGFDITDNNVYIHCRLTFENRSNSDVKIRINAAFDEDEKNGLLKQKNLYGIFTENNSNEYVVRANEKLRLINVDFVGEYAGNNQMANRLLPNINIEIVN